MSDDLTSELRDAFPASVVEPLGHRGWRVLFPNPRWPHDYLSISVEPVDGGWLLSDSGEIASVADEQFGDLLRLLTCAGAEVDHVAGVVTTHVFEDESLTSRLLTFAHYLISASVLWRARHCLDEVRPPSGAESPTRHLARETRERLIARIGGQSHAVIHLDRPLRARGETVRAPLVVAPPSLKAQPRLVAAFLDTHASEAVTSSAKRLATWTFEVVHTLMIPKYFVVHGSDEQVEHFAEFYDHHNVTALSFSHGHQLEVDAWRVVASMGLATEL